MSQVMDALSRVSAGRARGPGQHGHADAVLATLGYAPHRRARSRRKAATLMVLFFLIFLVWTLYG